MKRALLLIGITLLGTITFAQKQTNGSLYIEHPAIKIINDFEKATVAGDSAKIASFLTDNFKFYNGTTTNLTSPFTDKATFLNTALHYSRDLDYFAIEPIPGSYPDALEYKKDNKDGDVVVQNWIMIKGVHKATGVKLDAAAHRIYYITKDNKIKTIISYSNTKVIDELFASYSNRTNGKIYNHHENINTVRKVVYAFEKGDVDKALSFFTDNAKFFDINSDWNKSINKAEYKAQLQKLLSDFEIKSIDIIGYPDYLEYEMDNGRSALSWWKLNLVRKSDKKSITLPMHINDDFDDNGKITSQIVYYSESMLLKK